MCLNTYMHPPYKHTRGVMDCMNYVVTRVGGPEMLKVIGVLLVVRSNSVWKPDGPGGEKHGTGFVEPTRLQVYATVLPK